MTSTIQTTRKAQGIVIGMHETIQLLSAAMTSVVLKKTIPIFIDLFVM